MFGNERQQQSEPHGCRTLGTPIPRTTTGLPDPARFREFVSPEDSFANERKGVRAAFSARPIDVIELNFTAGYQESAATKVEISNGFSPLMLVEDKSWYVDMRGSGHGVFRQANLDGSTVPDGSTLKTTAVYIRAEQYINTLRLVGTHTSASEKLA